MHVCSLLLHVLSSLIKDCGTPPIRKNREKNEREAHGPLRSPEKHINYMYDYNTKLVERKQIKSH